MKYNKPKVIAEIGCNHMGSIEVARELIDLAVLSKADVAKFQKRNPRELLSEEQYNAPHPNPRHSYGSSYGEHRENLEFTAEQHRELMEYCVEMGIDYSTSVWDESSAKDIIQFKPAMLRIPSASNTNFSLLEVLRDEYEGDIHISLGMTTHEEEAEIIEFFSQKGNGKERLVIYSCTSGYPVPFENVSLLEITRLIESYGSMVKAVGFSGHHLGIAIDNAAYTLGAEYVERHFTKDRTLKGTDHAASLEPTGLQKLVRDLNATYKSLTYKERELLDIELEQREKLKYREKH